MNCNDGKLSLTFSQIVGVVKSSCVDKWSYNFANPTSSQMKLKMCRADGHIQINFLVGVELEVKGGGDSHHLLAKQWGVPGHLSWIAQCRFNFQVISIEILLTIALMRDDIRLAKITTKAQFENANLKFYHVLISKAAKMKRIPRLKQHEGNEGLKKCGTNKAWWWILSMLHNRK